MADPLSVAGLVMGVVSLGLQVSSGITTYIDALKCRKEDIASVRQLTDSLQKTLQVIESSLPRLHVNDQAATEAAHGCIDSCNQELKALGSLIADFTAYDQPPTSRRNRVKTTGKKLLYPFSRSKLTQLEIRLRNANAALQLALQALDLSVSQLGTEKLVTMEASSHHISANLLVVQSEVSALSTPLCGINHSVSAIQTRFDNLEHRALPQIQTRLENLENLVTKLLVDQQASHVSPQQVTNSGMAIGRLVGKPSALRELCDAVPIRTRPSWPLISQTAGASHAAGEERCSMVPSISRRRSKCTCRSRQHFLSRRVIWSSVVLSLETATEQHLPGCPARQTLSVEAQSHEASLTYLGLRYLLRSAVKLSFTIKSGAGGGSIGASFTYCPTVDAERAPAFRILSLVRMSLRFCPLANPWTSLMTSVRSTLLALFITRQESPRAVDIHNRSLVHYLADCLSILDSGNPPGERRVTGPLLEVLKCLIANNAPTNDYDLFGKTPLASLLPPTTPDSSSMDRLANTGAELILETIDDDKEPWLPTYIRDVVFSLHESTCLIIRPLASLRALSVLARSPKMAEVCGCGPLSLAVLSNNEAQIKQLLRAEPSTLTEQNMFGQTALHLAADKPSYLRHLLRAADTSIISHRDLFGMSALELAVATSGKLCRQRSIMHNQTSGGKLGSGVLNKSQPSSSGAGVAGRKCRGCACAASTAMLLKSDCALLVPLNLDGLLSTASHRCKLRYSRHLKQRRDKLERLALDNLPPQDVERLGLASGVVLDSRAFEVIQLLQNRGVQIPDALRTTNDNSPGRSVYHALHNIQDAKIFFQAGFGDTEVFSTLDETESHNFVLDAGLAYLRWLAEHGFDVIFRQFTPLEAGRGLYAAHFTFMAIAHDIEYWDPKDRQVDLLELAARRAWIHGINAAALPADMADNCYCRCSPNGCSPLTTLLKTMSKWTFFDPCWLLRGDRIDFIRYLEHFGRDFELKHHIAALRALTFNALRIQHTCCNVRMLYFENREVPSMEDVEEFEAEHATELALLEELLVEFEADIAGILQDPNRGLPDLIHFWKHTWAERMNQVRRSLTGNELSVDERERAEDIGVIWDVSSLQSPPPVSLMSPVTLVNNASYGEWAEEYWMQELESIKAEYL